MATKYQYVFLTVLFMAVVMASATEAFTDPLDATALQELYKSLNNPPQLTGWRLDGGDPCDESWTGVSCSGSHVTEIELHGLNLSGFISAGLHNLYYLKRMDISSNNISGEIPYVLPPNATHIDMACNSLTNSIPQCLGGMKHLQYLNLSHNMLSGAIGNIFTGLKNLRQLDLSYNNFTALPSSFGSLTNLNGLYLHDNQLTGSLTSRSSADKKWLVVVWISFVVVAAVFACCMASYHCTAQPGQHRIGAAAQPDQNDHIPAVAQPGQQAAIAAAAQPGQQPAVAAVAQPGQQPAVAAVAQPGQQAPIAGSAQSPFIVSPDPDVLPATYISSKKKRKISFGRFEGGIWEMSDGIRTHTADSREKVIKLASPAPRVEQPRRKMSFINQDNEVEEYAMVDDDDDDDDECKKKTLQ